MKEADIWAGLKAGDWDFAERQEPGITNLGLPDVLLVHRQVVRFVELKCGRFGRDGVFRCQSEVRGSQVRWHTMFQRASRESYFLLGVSADEIYLLSGAYAKRLKHGGVTAAQMYRIKALTIEGLLEAFDVVSGVEINERLGHP